MINPREVDRVLVEPAPDARVSRDEIFGPVCCVYGFDQLDDAIGRANSLPVAFQASVFAAGRRVSGPTPRHELNKGSARKAFTMKAFARSTKNDPASAMSSNAFGEGP